MASAAANGIIATPRAANNPIPVKTNRAVAGFPKAANPPANAINPAAAGAPSRDMPPKNTNDGIAAAPATANNNNAADPRMVADIAINPLDSAVKFGSSCDSETNPIKVKNGIEPIAAVADMANTPKAAAPTTALFNAIKPADRLVKFVAS